MPDLPQWIRNELVSRGVAESIAPALGQTLVFVLVALIAVLANFVAKRIILRALKAFIARTPTRYDDYFLTHNVFDRLSHLAPAMVLHASSAVMFPDSEELRTATEHLAIAYMFLITAIVISSVINALGEIYETFEVARTRPIKSYLQVVKIIVFSIAGVLVVSALTNRSPWGLLSGIGALTAIIILVFRDSILGLVASIQVTANDMVRPGDWIEMPKFGADGDVIEVSLNTVKIRNFDKTISTVPTYALVSETFKNYRGMSETGGRRIKRALYLDQNSVHFASPELLDRLEKIAAIADYVRERRAEVQAYNAEQGFGDDVPVNGRRMTNLGTFRAYVLAYLKRHPKIRQDLTLLVRQLAPGPEGIPLEIYCFTNDPTWALYEGIQADIFDHLLAVASEFELRVFQKPSGRDLEQAFARRAS
ncbi:MAG: mechanosensitive ion channel family protein [Myxococcales bacterium]|jgi:miniconductance mechanosensitive channel